jgi:serine/threonine protein kinase
MQVPYVGRYVMHSSIERRAGGQGVVQFAHHISQANSEYAIKFYTQFDAFARERDLYMEPVLRKMMPATHEFIGNEDKAIHMPDGYIFPPSIVIEKGESLDVWARREQHDFITTMQVLCHIAERLQVLHAAGWVHRDIKPGNVLRRPVHHSWTLIDFGCTARVGAFHPGVVTSVHCY